MHINVKIVLPMYESHTMPFQLLYHKSSKYYKVQIPDLYGSNSKITRFKLILEMKFSSSAANARADPPHMDIREVQTNITASKSGFETSHFCKGVSHWEVMYGVDTMTSDYSVIWSSKMKSAFLEPTPFCRRRRRWSTDHSFLRNKCRANLITFSTLALRTKNLRI